MKTLREFLSTCPDSAWIVVPESDHNYRRVRAEKTTALSGRGWLYENFGEGYKNDENDAVIDVVVIGN